MNENNGAATDEARQSPNRATPATLLDLDAFMTRGIMPPTRPQPRVRIGGIEYSVRQLVHLTGQEELDLAALDRAVQDANTPLGVRRAMFDRAFGLVRVLVPNMPEKDRLSLSYEQAIAVADLAWDYAVRTVNPPMPDTPDVPAESSKRVSGVPLAFTPAV